LILFCDPSALVKLYIKEDASEQMAALARRARENPADAAAIETARANGIEPMAWLTDTLKKLPSWPNSRIDELLPLKKPV
jgi:hypothetical protein